MSETVGLESSYDQSKELENLINRLDSEVMRTINEKTVIDSENNSIEDHENKDIFKVLGDHTYSLSVFIKPEIDIDYSSEFDLQKVKTEFNERNRPFLLNAHIESDGKITMKEDSDEKDEGECVYINEIMAEHTYSVCQQNVQTCHIITEAIKQELIENDRESTPAETIIGYPNDSEAEETNDSIKPEVSMDQFEYDQGCFLQAPTSFRITDDGTLESLEESTAILQSGGHEKICERDVSQPLIEVADFNPEEVNFVDVNLVNCFGNEPMRVQEVESDRQLIKIPDFNGQMVKSKRNVDDPAGKAKKKSLMWSDCGYKFIEKVYLNEYNLWVNFDIFSCSKCQFKTKKSITLVNHFKRGHYESVENNKCESVYKCMHCKFMAKAKSLVMKHFKARHCKDQEVPIESTKVLMKMFKCEICNYVTNIKCNLKVHERNMHNPILIPT